MGMLFWNIRGIGQIKSFVRLLNVKLFKSIFGFDNNGMKKIQIKSIKIINDVNVKFEIFFNIMPPKSGIQ